MYRIQIYNRDGKLNHSIKREDWNAVTVRDAYNKALRENPERDVELQYRGSDKYRWLILWNSAWTGTL